jgi:hypothetical protein
MTREQQVSRALATRERQVERALRIEAVLVDWNDGSMPAHHGYAVCVKDRTLGGSRVSYDDEDSIRRYDHVRDQWWEDASEIAREHGFTALYSEGRSGGYAKPEPQPHVDDLYDEDVEAWLRESFAPLVIDLRDLMREYRERWERGDFDDFD